MSPRRPWPESRLRFDHSGLSLRALHWLYLGLIVLAMAVVLFAFSGAKP